MDLKSYEDLRSDMDNVDLGYKDLKSYKVNVGFSYKDLKKYRGGVGHKNYKNNTMVQDCKDDCKDWGDACLAGCIRHWRTSWPA